MCSSHAILTHGWCGNKFNTRRKRKGSRSYVTLHTHAITHTLSRGERSLELETVFPGFLKGGPGACSCSSNLLTPAETKLRPGTCYCCRWRPFEMCSHLTTTLLCCCLTIVDQWGLTAALSSTRVPRIPFTPLLDVLYELCRRNKTIQRN